MSTTQLNREAINGAEIAWPPDKGGLMRTLKGYGRCIHSYSREYNETVSAVSNGTVDHTRFQRDLYGPSVNIVGHGYVITESQRVRLLERYSPEIADVDYEDRPYVLRVGMEPLTKLLREGRGDWEPPMNDYEPQGPPVRG